MSSWIIPLAGGLFSAVLFTILFFVRGRATNAYLARLLYERGLEDLADTFLRKEVWSKKYKRVILYEARLKTDEIYE